MSNRHFGRRRLLLGLGGLIGAEWATAFLGGCSGSGKQAATQGAGPAELRRASAPGVTADTITLGSICALSGPAAGYATLAQTIDAYFKRVNNDGGINGRSVRLVVADDQDQPGKSRAAAQRLIEQEHVFALVGNVGTATTEAVVDYATKQGVPMLFLESGSLQWSDAAKHANTLSLPVPYATEARIFGRYIANTWPDKAAGILYQNDDFGKSYLGLKAGLAPGNRVADEEPYERGTGDLVPQLAGLRSKGTKVLVIAAAPRPAGLALRGLAAGAWKPAILLSSVAADPSLFGLAGGAVNVEGVVSGIWQRQYDDGSAGSEEVKDLLSQYAPQVQFTQLSMTGYLAAELMAETLKRAGVNPTRASLLTAAESFRDFTLPQLPPGSSVSTSKTDHAPLKALQFVRATGGRFVPFGEALT